MSDWPSILLVGCMLCISLVGVTNAIEESGSCPDCNCVCEIQEQEALQDVVFNPKIQRMVDCTSACTQALIYSDSNNKIESQEKCFSWCEEEIGYNLYGVGFE